MMKNLLDYLKSKWDTATLMAIYLALGGAFILAFCIISAKRQEAEQYCTDHRAILITDKSGTYYCIKEKSIVK